MVRGGGHTARPGQAQEGVRVVRAAEGTGEGAQAVASLEARGRGQGRHPGGAARLAALAVAWAAAGRALRPVAEAEARERAFICTASHDLVTPLMAVTANCDVLEAEASDQAGLASWVANIRAAADEMATHIADMLMHMGGD